MKIIKKILTPLVLALIFLAIMLGQRFLNGNGKKLGAKSSISGLLSSARADVPADVPSAPGEASVSSGEGSEGCGGECCSSTCGW